MGRLGNTILVNFTPKTVLNASTARMYRLAFVKGNTPPLPYVAVGTDGGLLDKPRQVQKAFLSPAERLHIPLDLSLSSRVTLSFCAVWPSIRWKTTETG